MKVALAMIVAGVDNDGKALARCLGSVNGYVDEMYIQLNAPKGKQIDPRVREIAERFTNNVFVYEWRSNFVDARNDIFSKVPKKMDWIVWLDEDDIVAYPEMIQRSLAVMPNDVNGVYILYDYQTDEYGNVIVAHWTSRAVRNNGSYGWKSSIDDDKVAVHETLNPKRGSPGVSNDEWKVVHMALPLHHRESLLRNIELLEGMYERQSKKPEGVDPRILFYLGTHFYDAYRFKEAKDLFYQYLKMSGWAEERAEAHTYMGKLLMMEGNKAGAKAAFLMAMGEYPDNNGPYVELAKLEAKEQRWEQGAAWAKRGLDIKRDTTTMVKYNRDYDLLTQYANALSNLGGPKLKEAFKTAQKALELRPYDPDAITNRDTVQGLIKHRDDLRAITRTLSLLVKSSSDADILRFLDSLPEDVNDSPVVISARQKYSPAKKWPKKSIAIFVGQGPLGNWSPKNLDKQGLGGSEEAVIRLSWELAKEGWSITVFGTPGIDAGDYVGTHRFGDGDYEKNSVLLDSGKTKLGAVTWTHFWEINQKDTFDVLISWRQPAFFDLPWKARKKYLWSHDVMEKDELTDERINNLTKIIYVSKYHSERPESSEVGDKKKFPSGNGITPIDFEKFDGRFKRDPHRCIYMSANERGLRILYDVWPDVKRAVPDATLDIYYGWHSFDAINRDNPERMAWKATMVQRAKELPGVEEKGRIGQEDLTKEIFKSGVWAYPSFFPEVNCITGQKAMAGGAVPVTSDFANLKDIVQFGEQVPMNDFQEADIKRYKKRLIWWLQHPEEQEKVRGPMMTWARSKYDWKNTAEQWSGEME